MCITCHQPSVQKQQLQKILLIDNPHEFRQNWGQNLTPTISLSQMYNYRPQRNAPYQQPAPHLGLLPSISNNDAPSASASSSSSSSSSSFNQQQQQQPATDGNDSAKRAESGAAKSTGSADEGEAYVSRTLYICKLPPDFSEDEIRQACEPFGDIKGIMSYQSRQIAFVEYWDIRNAQAARVTLKNLRIGGRLVEVQYSKTQNEKIKERNTGTLYVRPVTTERFFHDPNQLQQYKDLFQKFGDVKKVNTNRKRDAEKFVEFHDLRAAEAAQEALNDMDFNGVKLEVQFANTQSKTINKETGEPQLHPPRSRFRKDGSNPASSSHYGPIRSSGFSDVPNSSSSSRPHKPDHQRHQPPPAAAFDSLPSNAPLSLLGELPFSSIPIKLHWQGTFGPTNTQTFNAPDAFGSVTEGNRW